MMLNTLKTMAAAATLAVFGSVATAATIAEIDMEGTYAFFDFNGEDALNVTSGFYAAFDPTFDTSATNDFLFDLEFNIDGVPAIALTTPVAGVTGDSLIGIAASVIGDINLALPGVLNNLVDELTDTNFTASEISPGVWLNFGISPSGSGVSPDGLSFVEGSLSFLLSSVDINRFSPIPTPGPSGVFSGTATISTAMNMTPVPLPATLPLLAFATAGLIGLGRRRKAA